jgi:hypothetical protein
MANDKKRERYYKAKAHPAMGRGMDGEVDILAYMNGPLHLIALDWQIDRDRRDPEDELSMDCCSYTREFYELDKSLDELWSPDMNRENRALLVYPHHLNSDQSRENG